MNRWRLRLIELQCGGFDEPTPVQDVQNVQNYHQSPTSERFEHSEQRASAKRREAPTTNAELIAPSGWFERIAPTADGEPGFEMRCAARRGRIEERGSAVLHFCAECGAWGAFGYGVNLRAGLRGRWFCGAHRPQPTAKLSP